MRAAWLKRAERARRAEQVPDVGAIHHHAAEDGELRQRRTEGGEVASQHARVERHRLQHAARRGRAADAGRIVGVVGIGPEANFAVRLQEVDHARRRGPETRQPSRIAGDCRRCPADSAEPARGCRRFCRGGNWGPIRNPQSAPWCRRRFRPFRPAATSRPRMAAREGGRHAAGSGAQHQQVHFRG